MHFCDNGSMVWLRACPVSALIIMAGQNIALKRSFQWCVTKTAFLFEISKPSIQATHMALQAKIFLTKSDQPWIHWTYLFVLLATILMMTGGDFCQTDIYFHCDSFSKFVKAIKTENLKIFSQFFTTHFKNNF